MLGANYPANNKSENEPHPDYFKTWDNAVKKGVSPGFFEIDDLCDIIDIYFNEGQMNRAKFAIDYAFKLHPENEELIYEVLLLLNDYELWNDLLVMSEKYKDIKQVWADGHKITALLHLGMEEDAFHFFKRLKYKYANDKENLSIVYQAMGEALYEIDLFDATIDVIGEALTILGQDTDLLWLQLQSYFALDDKESVESIATQIQKLNPMDGDCWNRLGGIYKEIGDIKKEIEAFEFALSLGVKDPGALLDLIQAYEKNENLNKALEKANDYLASYPRNYLVTLIAANICSKIENWGKALEYIDNALRLNSSLETLYLYKSDLFVKMGEQKKAILILEEGIKETKDSSGDLVKQLESLRKQYPEY